MAKISEEGDKYILSPLGEKFIKYVLDNNVNVKHVTGTKTEIQFETITDDEIDDMVNRALAE